MMDTRSALQLIDKEPLLPDIRPGSEVMSCFKPRNESALTLNPYNSEPYQAGP